MKVPASTILSFVTGRLYSTTPPTVLFAPMLSAATGQSEFYTHQLPQIKSEFAFKILAQCPYEFQMACQKWEHTQDWKERVQMIDEAFGEINIEYCA